MLNIDWAMRVYIKCFIHNSINYSRTGSTIASDDIAESDQFCVFRSCIWLLCLGYAFGFITFKI